MGVRLPKLPFYLRAERAPFGTGYLRVSVRLTVHTLLRLGLSEAALSRKSSPPRPAGRRIGNATADKQRPDDACRLVGEGNGDNACRPTCQQLLGPNRAAGAAGVTHQRCSAENEKSADI